MSTTGVDNGSSGFLGVCGQILSGIVHYTIVIPYILSVVVINLLETSAMLWIILICMPTILVSPSLYRRITDFIVEEFCRFTIQLFSITAQVRLKISGDDLTSCKEEPWPVFLCNHRTQMDMVPAWLLLYKYSLPCSLIKFMAARYTRYVPGYGCGLQVMRSIFLTRQSKSKDVQQIRDVIAYHKFYDMPKGVLMYPEGTTLYEDSLADTNRFAEKRGLPPKQYTLYPRHAGFHELISTMSRENLLENSYIYDITIGYEDYRGMLDDFTLGRILLGGSIQRNIHLHVRKFATSDVAVFNEEERKEWLYQLYAEKEERLRYFETAEVACLNFGDSSTVVDGTFSFLETLAGLFRIASHLSLVGLMIVVPWYLVRLYKVDDYAGIAAFPGAILALTVIGELVGLDNIETWLSKFHLLIICWPAQVKWKDGFFNQNASSEQQQPDNVGSRISAVFQPIQSRFHSLTSRYQPTATSGPVAASHSPTFPCGGDDFAQFSSNTSHRRQPAQIFHGGHNSSSSVDAINYAIIPQTTHLNTVDDHISVPDELFEASAGTLSTPEMLV